MKIERIKKTDIPDPRSKFEDILEQISQVKIALKVTCDSVPECRALMHSVKKRIKVAAAGFADLEICSRGSILYVARRKR